MTAPDSDRSSEGGGVPPEAMATGQRTLAAIVFTDTVAFSKLMSKDEERTLRLVARDLDYMKTTCEAFGGQVLKSTGDGLLMLFTSAVQAVACALEIQRDFHKQGLELPPGGAVAAPHRHSSRRCFPAQRRCDGRRRQHRRAPADARRCRAGFVSRRRSMTSCTIGCRFM